MLKLQGKFPKHSAIASLRSWLYLQTGRFQELIELLDAGNLAERGWQKHRAQMLGEIALHEYRFEAAEQHWREAIAFKPTSPHEYIRLSYVWSHGELAYKNTGRSWHRVA